MTGDEVNVTSSVSNIDADGCNEYYIVSSCDLTSAQNNESNSEFSDDPTNLINNQKFSFVRQYQEEWNEHFGRTELDLNELRIKSTEGHLRTSHFRSICWRCLLGILHKCPKEWLCQLQMYRSHYDEIYTELEQNPWNVKESNPTDNPLSQESDSIWLKYFCDEELKSVIHQDVKRTFPGMEFFKKDYIQEMMVRILFCYARQNPSLCYQQGMHEILAPILFILHCDHQSYLHAREKNLITDQIMHEVLNPEKLEQDAFSIFKFIMNHIECSYKIYNVTNTTSAHLLFGIQLHDNVYQNEVTARLENIKKTLLQTKDPELNEYLEKLDIPLHLFGIRWLRLLFGREFSLQDLLVLWDFIFAYNFETINYIVVAMLIAIRQILLKGDYTECLSSLMRYPNEVDVMFVIEYALHLMDPRRHAAPSRSRMPVSKKVVDNIHLKKKNDTASQFTQRLNKDFTREQNRFPEKQLATVSAPAENGNERTDPNLLKTELDQTKMVMKVVHHKLEQFHTILSENVQSTSSPDVQAVVDGIYELSCLLKNYTRETSCEIETACEAIETKDIKSHNIHLNTVINSKKLKQPIVSINSKGLPHTLPKLKKGPKSGELTVFKHHVGGSISGAPMKDPLHLLKKFTTEDSLRS